MKVQIRSKRLQILEIPVLILPVFQDKKVWPHALNFLIEHLHPVPDQLFQHPRPEWKLHQKRLIYTTHNRIPLVVLQGAGKESEWNLDKARQWWGAALQVMNELKEVKAGIYWDGQFPQTRDPENLFIECVAALHTAAYRVTHFQTEREELPPEVEMIEIIHPHPPKRLTKWLETGEHLGKAVNLARQLAEFPSNELTPQVFVKRMRELGEIHKWQLEVLDRKALEKKRMNALLAVAQGSDHSPYLAIASYRHPAAKQTVGLVGKGVTFDSGGISIKPSKNMEEMKYDMSGAAAVLGALSVVSATRLPINVVAALPLVENMPSGKAIRPGDIVRSYSGKTIEIINTDAEGRLILADALSYLEQKYQPDVMVDLATLTGAVVVALGNMAAAVLSEKDDLTRALREAGDLAGEKLWPLPLWEDYKELMKSKLADVRNISTKSGAGAITAAIFLQQFVGKTAWAHLDIAGTAYGMPAKSHRPEGATGFGVKLLWYWISSLSK
ncbi:MAG: leucyl aminopeptidase [bacterium]|nr:MAG: leucyl aminopeptidase [bacterium]